MTVPGFIILLLTLLDAQVCSKHVVPSITNSSMQGTTVLIGQDAEFHCRIENLGRHKVAFVRSSTPSRLISFDEKIFRNAQKYELRAKGGPQANEWSLIVRNEEDRGNYTCQVNTEPLTVKTAALDVRVPPSVSRNTPSAVEVREGHNVTLNCKAEGTPEPSVIWRRADRQIIRFNGATGYGATIHKGAQLHLVRVSRKHMAEYVCVASNGIPPDESWTVRLMVTFARLVCDVESWPRPEVVWERDGVVIFDSDHFSTSQVVSQPYHTSHVLEIRKVRPEHYGSYRCLARNENGRHHADIYLRPDYTEVIHTNAISEGSGASVVPFDDTDPEAFGSGPDDEDVSTNQVHNLDRNIRHPTPRNFDEPERIIELTSPTDKLRQESTPMSSSSALRFLFSLIYCIAFRL